MSQGVIRRWLLSEDEDETRSARVAGVEDDQGTEKLRERDEDLIYGQPVIVTARWILVASGLVLALWNAETLGTLRLQLMVILLLAGVNFYLHAQLLMQRSVIKPAVYGASAADLLLITVLVASQGGFHSNLYVFYFPAIAALSVAFSTQWTAEYVVATMTAYAMIALFSGGDLPVIISRLLMFAAIGFCGNRYRHIERARRRAASRAFEGGFK